jgi:formylglycine-generating enzyme required for sulfatase activity
MRKIVCLFLVLGICAVAQANITVDTVFVGNVGNTGELSGLGAGGYGADRICGEVDYYYRMGKFEITCAQYTAFLNAVAATDTYGLYRTEMQTGVSTYSIGIDRTGSPGSYTYSVTADRANRPAGYINWGATVRFANWMENGQPTGPQNLSTTEDGSYFVNGANSTTTLNAVVRKSTAHWVLPTEDEWYKAAYHKNDGVTGNYWDYETGTDAIPSYTWAETDPGNTATWTPDKTTTYTIGAPYWRTEVGHWTASASPYGTFDMGGNVMEWTEQIVNNTRRELRGGSYDSLATSMFAGYRSGLSSGPTYNTSATGFRLAYLPEPATLVLLGFGALAMLRRRS